MSKIGVVSGSFDPITMGHIHVIEKSLTLVDKIIVLMGNNPAKKYHFSVEERQDIIEQSLYDAIPERFNDISVKALPDKEFTALYGYEKFNATTIFRGMRNIVDFEYEYAQQLFNAKIAPMVTTVYIVTPPKLIEVSSSMAKSIVGMRDWRDKIRETMPPYAIEQLARKLGE